MRQRRPHRHRQSGFTLVELAFAGMIAAGLTLVALELLLSGANLKLELDGKLRVNQAARQTMAMIADGADGGAGGTDGTTLAHGVRNRAGPVGVASGDDEVLQISGNGLTATGDRTSPMTVVCAGTGDPVPACANLGATVTLNGALVGLPRFQDTDRSVAGQTVETEIFLRDPWSAARGHGRVERYGGIHIYNAQEGEGAAGAAADPVGTDP